ncbi:MAG: ATP-binding protein [Candidatus Bruticola sp.]
MTRSEGCDPATGLPFLRTLYGRVAEALEQGREVGFLFFDIKQFSVLIKKQGEAQAISIMAALGKALAERYRSICREADLLAVSEESCGCFYLLLLSPPRLLPKLTIPSVKKASQRILKFFNAVAEEVAAEFGLHGCLKFRCGGSVIPVDSGIPIDRLIAEAKRDADRRSDLKEILTNFLSNIIHEMRTPLTCIKGYTENLLDGAVENKELAYQWLRIISEEADRMDKLISDLTDISMIEAHQFEFHCEAVDFAALVRHAADVVQISASKHNIQIVVNCPDNLPLMMLDPDRISQVIINLLDNAVKYSVGGKLVEMSVCCRNNSQVELSVRDYGPGIPDSKLPYLFDRFYRGVSSKEAKGRGLGLSIAKCIAEAHGGQILVHSTVGSGSTFILSLPIVLENQQPDQVN